MLFSKVFAALAFGAAYRSPEKAANAKPVEYNGLESVLSSINTFHPPQADARDLLSLYNTNPWVRSIVGRIGSLVARQCWYLEDNAGNEIESHPAIDFLMAGNPELTGGMSLKMTAIHIDLAGEAFWVLGRDKTGRPASYAVIPPHEIANTPTIEHPFFTVRRQDGTQKEYPATEVLWFRDPDPLNPYVRGRSITGAAHTELKTDEAASEHVYAHLKNRARPDFIVHGKGDSGFNPKDIAAFELTWLQKLRGKGGGKPFFSSREIGVIPVSATLKDTEMSTLRPELRAIITEIYGVPPEVFGRLDNSNRATIDSANFLLATHTVDPRLWFLQQTLAPFITREFKLPRGVTLEYETPILEDREFQLKVMVAKPDAFTGDEFRELADFEGMGGDMAKLPEKPAPVAPPTDPNGNPTDPNGGKKPPVNDTSNAPEKVLATSDEAAHKDGAAHPTLATQKQLAPADIVDVSSSFDDPQVKVTITALIDQLYKQLIERYGIGLLTMLERDANFALNTSVANWLATEIPHLLDEVDQTTKDALTASLTTGVAENAAVADLINRVESVFAEAADQRAGTISQTEATHLAGFASQTAAEQGGFAEKMWLSSGDQKVRSAHKAMDGQVVHVTQSFRAPNGDMAPYPGGFGKAGQDINCRCAIRPVLEGETKAVTDNFDNFHTHALGTMSADIAKAFRHIFATQKAMVIQSLKHRAGLN